MRTNPSRRNLSNYCHFHKDHGHDTSKYFELKEQIESLVRQGQLQEYVRNPEDRVKSEQRESSKKRKEKKKEDSDENMFDVNHIWGGSAVGDFGKSRKNLAHQARYKFDGPEVNLSNQFQGSMVRDILIIFSEDDTRGVHHPHCDALVVTIPVANKRLHQILIDNESSADILFLSAFTQMGLERSPLKPSWVRRKKCSY